MGEFLVFAGRGSGGSEPARGQEIPGGRDDAAVLHEERVGAADDEVFPHAGDFGGFDRDLAVVGAGNHEAVDPIDGAGAGHDAQFETDWAESVGFRGGVGAELGAGGAVELLECLPFLEIVDDFAAAVGRSEHDDAAEARVRVARKIGTHEDAAEGVRDEMDGGAIGQGWGGERAADGEIGEGVDGGGSGRIVDVEDDEAVLFEGGFHGFHAGGGAAEAVEEDDALGGGSRRSQGKGRGGGGKERGPPKAGEGEALRWSGRGHARTIAPNRGAGQNKPARESHAVFHAMEKNPASFPRHGKIPSTGG